jgi:hypothetical protein
MLICQANEEMPINLCTPAAYLAPDLPARLPILNPKSPKFTLGDFHIPPQKSPCFSYFRANITLLEVLI